MIRSLKLLKAWQAILLLAIVAAVAGGAYTAYARTTAPPISPLPANTQLAAVQLGTVTNAVSASGSLAFPNTASLTFGGTGTVLEVKVKVGDSVKKGQVLASIDTETLARTVAQSRLSLMTAEVNLKKAREPYTPGDVEKAQAAVSQAEVALKRAQKALQDAQSSDPIAVGARGAAVAAAEEALRQAQTPDPLVVATRQAALDMAQVNLRKAQDDLAALQAPTAAELAAASAAVARAATVLQNAQSDLEALQATSATGLARASAAVAQATTALQSAKDEVATAYGDTAIQVARANVQAKTVVLQAAQDSLAASQSTSETTLEKAQAVVNQARAAHDQSQDDLQQAKTSDPVVVATRQAALKQAQNELALLVVQRQAEVDGASASLLNARENLETVKAGADADDLASKQLQYQTAKTALDDAQLSLAEATMVASINGTVAAVNISVGQKVSGDVAAITIVDTSTVEVNAVVTEMDLSRIKQGQGATLSLDGLPGVGVSGVVSTISVMGKATSGVVSYPLTIAVTPPQGAILGAGMSATASIVIQQLSNVLVVPNRAIGGSTRSPAVSVMVNGKIEERAVKVGLSDDTRTEVVEGLRQGDMVLVASSSASQQRFPGGMGGGGPIMQFIR